VVVAKPLSIRETERQADSAACRFVSCCAIAGHHAVCGTGDLLLKRLRSFSM
jgi:hypothetical protein